MATTSGDVDFGITAFTAGLYNLAGKGTLKVIGGMSREKAGYPLIGYFASNNAYAAGLKTPKDLAGKRVAVTPSSAAKAELVSSNARHVKASFMDSPYDADAARVNQFCGGSFRRPPHPVSERDQGDCEVGPPNVAVAELLLAYMLIVGKKRTVSGSQFINA